MKRTFFIFLLASLIVINITIVYAASPFFSPPLANKNVNVGETLNYDIDAIDPDNDTLTFSDDSAKFEIDHSTGVINWTPTNADAGTFNVNVTVTDGTNSVTEVFQVHVNRKPVFASLPSLELFEGTTNSSLDLDDYVSDADNDTITFSYSSNNIAVTITQDHKVVFTPTQYWYGSETVTFTASDSYSQVQQAINITVLPVNDAPSYAEIPTQQLQEDSSKELNLSSYFFDVDGDNLTFSIYEQPNHLSATISGQIMTFVSEEGWTGIDSIKILASDGSLNKTTGDIKLLVGPRICSDGLVGDLEIRIEDPDNNEEFYPGETVKVEARVENNGDEDLYVTAEAILYNMDEGEEVDSFRSGREKIRDGASNYYQLDFSLSNLEDLDEEDTYYLYVKSYESGGETDHCAYDFVELDFERDEHKVIIKNMDLSPSTEIRCGESFELMTTVENLGTTEEDGYIQVASPKLGIKKYSQSFVLPEYDEQGSSRTEMFELSMPSDVNAGEYWLNTAVYYNDGKDFEEKTIKLNVECEAQKVKTQLGEITGEVVVKPVTDSITVKSGRKTFSVPILLFNNGATAINPVINIKGIDMWAKLTGLEQPQTIAPNKEAHAYAYFVVNDGVAEGAHDLTVEVLADNKVVGSYTLSVNLETGTAVEKNAEEEIGVGEGTNRKIFWVGLDILMIIFAIWIIKVLFGR